MTKLLRLSVLFLTQNNDKAVLFDAYGSEKHGLCVPNVGGDARVGAALGFMLHA